MATIFVTRKFPPSVGGMETLAFDVWHTLRTVQPDALLVAHGRSNTLLPVFVARAAIQITGEILRGRVDFVLVGDVVLYILLAPLLRACRVRHAVMAMGKDLVWEMPAYRRLVQRTLRTVPHLLAISGSTAEAAVSLGVDRTKVDVVRLGVDLPEAASVDRRAARRALGDQLGLPDEAIVLLTLGRLVRRKGAAWFIREVLPSLPEGAVLIVAGDGDEAASVRRAASTSGASSRVHVLGAVDDDEKEILMRGADIFVQPNIRVEGDMEGFGLVAVEAAVRGSYVVAADLEGLRDAVVPGSTGQLVPSGDSEAWITRLTELMDDRRALAATAASFADRARELYSREAMGIVLARTLDLVDDPSA